MNIRIVGLLLAAIFTSSQLHAAIIIDDYTAGDPIAQFGAGTASDTTTDLGILGGTRNASVTVKDLGGAQDHGTLTFTNDVSIGQGTNDQNEGALNYEGISNFDLTEGGTNARFLLTVLSSDSPTPLTDVVFLTAVSNGRAATQFITIPSAAQLAGGPVSTYLDFDAFPLVDFESLDSISLGFDFTNHPGRDVALSFFGATTPASVPEPAGGLLLPVMGLFALMRRKQR